MIEVKPTRDNCNCNNCERINYRSKTPILNPTPSMATGSIIRIYDVRVGNHIAHLCTDCLIELYVQTEKIVHE